MPMVPHLSWVWFGGRKAVVSSVAKMRGAPRHHTAACGRVTVQVLLALGKERVPIVQWWLGQDSWSPCH